MIQPNRLISLGYGRYVRSEEIIAIEPVTEGRGPQRRALVWVRGIPTPLVASRSESALASDLLGTDRQDARVRQVRSMLRQASDALDETGEAA